MQASMQANEQARKFNRLKGNPPIEAERTDLQTSLAVVGANKPIKTNKFELCI